MDPNIENVLDRCIQRLRAGDSPADCLARFPEYAEELEPLLLSAQKLGCIAGWELPDGSWARHRSQVFAAVQERQTRRPWWAPLRWVPDFAQTRGLARAAVSALLLCVVLTATTTAASQPGDLPYDLRLLAERVPIWFAADPDARGVAELHYADHRLTDLQEHLRATGAVDPTALAALLDADEAAARDVAGLGRKVQERTATWITGHAHCLLQLSETALGPRAANTLRQAAEHALAIAATAQVLRQ